MNDGTRPVRGDSRRTVWIMLALVTLMAFALRVGGLSFQLPHTPANDEVAMFAQLEQVRGLPLRPGKASLPYAYPRLLARTANVILPRVPSIQPTTLAQHVEFALHDVLGMRWMIAILGTLAIPLTFALARRFTTDVGALLAAALLSASLLHVLYSSQARPHAALTTMTLLAVLASLFVLRRGSWLAYATSGIACAAACATLHSGVFTLPALVAAHLLRGRPFSLRALVKLALALGLVAAALVWAFPPEPPRPLGPGEVPAATDPIRGHGTELTDFRGAGFLAIARAFANYDPWIGAGSLAAIAAWCVLARRDRVRTASWTERARANSALVVVLAHALPHVLVFGLFERTFQRFMLPIVPYLCCAVAWVVMHAAHVLARRNRGNEAWYSSGLAVVALAPTLVLVTAFTSLKRAPDTQELAARWIEANLERTQARIAVAPTFDVPLVRHDVGQRRALLSDPFAFPLWTFHQVTRKDSELAPLSWCIDDVPLRKASSRALLASDPAAFFRELNATHIVVEVMTSNRRALLRDLREAARVHGRLVARFAPRDEHEGDLGLQYQLDGPHAPDALFAWRVALFDRLGPDIEIYELERTSGD